MVLQDRAPCGLGEFEAGACCVWLYPGLKGLPDLSRSTHIFFQLTGQSKNTQGFVRMSGRLSFTRHWQCRAAPLESRLSIAAAQLAHRVAAVGAAGAVRSCCCALEDTSPEPEVVPASTREGLLGVAAASWVLSRWGVAGVYTW